MRITVHAKPGSREESIEKINESEFRVFVKERPVEGRGKANEAIVKVLADHFGVDQRHVRIVGGRAARHKTVEIS